MQQKNNTKSILQEQNNQPYYNNKNPRTFKNLYAKIRKNIKTSFQSLKQKNSFNLANSKMLSENANKRKNNRNINLIFNKKEGSRNFNSNNVDKIFNNQYEEYNDNDDIFYFNKTQKNVNLWANNNFQKIIIIIITNIKIAKNDNKFYEHDMNCINNQLNYYSNKDKIK